ncbi:Importin 9, partial [Desmophyllum pertusum]
MSSGYGVRGNRSFLVFYDSKVSTMALCNVLQFFVNTGDKRLSSIIVKGERIFNTMKGEEGWEDVADDEEAIDVSWITVCSCFRLPS